MPLVPVEWLCWSRNGSVACLGTKRLDALPLFPESSLASIVCVGDLKCSHVSERSKENYQELRNSMSARVLSYPRAKEPSSRRGKWTAEV